MKKYNLIWIILLCLVGCQNANKGPQEEQSLKVLAFNSQAFNQTYGNFFLATHPNYTLNVVSIMERLENNKNITDTIQELIATENPDVIAIDMDSYAILSDQGELSTLEGFVQKDKFDLTTYTPAVIDFLTDDQNQLYGLSAAFTGKALYYNKKLFDQNGVAYPNDQVTWDDVFELAQRFPGEDGQEDRQTGLYYKSISTPFMMALTIGESSGLSFYNQNTFTLSSPSWEKIFDGVTKCFKNQVCYDGSQSVSSNSTVVSEMEKQTYPEK